MAKEIMERRASDNVYLHRDFYGALSTGIEYLHRTLGEDAVREYLTRFTRSYYAPVTRDIRERGIPAIRDYFERIYAIEESDVTFEQTEDSLTVHVAACPAVTHMRAHGYPVARLFIETMRTVNEALVEGTPFEAELSEYDDETGRSVQRFTRRRP